MTPKNGEINVGKKLKWKELILMILSGNNEKRNLPIKAKSQIF